MKQIQDNFATEQYFYGIYFQKKWKKYLKFFGKDLDILFGDDHNKKIRLSVGLDYLLNNKLNDAYHEIKRFEQFCVTNEEREIYNRLIKHCYNEKEMAQVKVGDWGKKVVQNIIKLFIKLQNILLSN